MWQVHIMGKVSSKSPWESCRSYLTLLKFSWSDNICCILNAVFSFINLCFSFLYGVIASLKKAGMLIILVHKGCLTAEKKIYNNLELCGMLGDSPALPLPYCGNRLSLPRLPEYCMRLIIRIAWPKDTHTHTSKHKWLYRSTHMHGY